MNVLFDPFVPVVRGGVRDEVSLLDLVREAPQIDDLDWGDPLVAASVLGIATALVTHAFGVDSVEACGELLEAGGFDSSRIEAYAEKYRARFELFGDTPFLQTGGLQPVSGGPKSVALLQLNVASGNNVPLFAPMSESQVPPMSAAAAARGLCAVLGFDTAAIKGGAAGDPKVSAGKTTGNPVCPLGMLGLVLPLGPSLFHTLVYNLPAMWTVDDDAPVWAREPLGPQWTTRQPGGPLEWLTWPSRRVRLVGDDDGVTGVVLCAGDRVAHVPQFEWRTGWRRPSKGGADVARPRRHQSGRAAWRGLPSIVETTLIGSDTTIPPGVIGQMSRLIESGYIDETEPVDIQLVGVEYGNQSAVIENVIADRTPLPLRSLRGDEGILMRRVITDMAVRADDVARELNKLGDNMRRSAGGEPIPWDKGQRLGEVFLAAVAPAAHRMLEGLGREPDKAEAAQGVWDEVLRRHAWRLAGPLLDNAPASTFRGHEHAVPNRDEPVVMRAQLAEVYFRAALNKILPIPEDGSQAVPSEISQEE